MSGDGTERQRGLRLAMISVHGLIRGTDPELGRDADTGGQTLYVIELARALGRHTSVEEVILFTRRVVDESVSPDYARREEDLGDHARIVRVDAGPDEYIRKEELWPHLGVFTDNVVSYYLERKRRPDVVHGHYADAGHVGIQVAGHFGVPLVFTGHSLGRVKRKRLLATGMRADEVEKRYHISGRINAEEDSLGAAELVVASTANEIEEQYARYDYYQPQQMRVIPPGTDVSRFHPPDGSERDAPMRRELARFLREPDKPFILAMSRPDERKNIGTLIDAYGESERLREVANLVIVAGSRDDIEEMDDGASRVLTDMLLRIDRHDLYGEVAYPKHNRWDEVPALYRLAASQRGVFVNPALTEPFGLTLIEAAASGVPVVATEDGGPRDIIGNCRNGLLVDPLDSHAIAAAILEVLEDHEQWKRLADSGLRGVRRHYSWEAHADHYVGELGPLLAAQPPQPRPMGRRRPMLFHDRALFTDIDRNLLGDPTALADLVAVLRAHRKEATFGIATGRRFKTALRLMRSAGIPPPDVLITAVGTEIYYAPEMNPDDAWTRHIDHLWTPRTVREVLAEVPGLELHPKGELSRFRLGYYYDPAVAPSPEELASLLLRADQTVNLTVSHGRFVDIVPVRASKGAALRWFSEQWGVPIDHILCAGGGGTDEDLLRGNTLAAVVANRRDEELSELTDPSRIYFAERPYAGGILEAVEHYDLYGACRVPEAA